MQESIDSYIFLNIVSIGINIILAVSLNLITGFTGQLSLGHAAFMSIGAYASGILTAKLGLPFIVGILGAALAAALAGVLIGRSDTETQRRLSGHCHLGIRRNYPNHRSQLEVHRRGHGT